MKPIIVHNKHYQECDVIMLATKNPTVLRENQMWTHTNDGGKTVKLQPTFNCEKSVRADELKGYCVPQDLYILSNDEIKKGDWCINKLNEIVQFGKNYDAKLYRKIIATTDRSLSTNSSDKNYKYLHYLPQIPQSFIERFTVEYNKGNVISKVLVKLQMYKGSVPVTWVSSLNDTNVYFLIKLNQNNEISILNNNPLFDNNDIEAAKKYIGLPLNREMDEEERYYHPRDKEYDAFLAGIAYEKSKRN